MACMTDQKALLDAGRLLGSLAELARRIGVSPARLNYWVNRSGKIPYEYVLAIERVTGGKVTRYQLMALCSSSTFEKNGKPAVTEALLVYERQLGFVKIFRHELDLFKHEMATAIKEFKDELKKIRMI